MAMFRHGTLNIRGVNDLQQRFIARNLTSAAAGSFVQTAGCLEPLGRLHEP